MLNHNILKVALSIRVQQNACGAGSGTSKTKFGPPTTQPKIGDLLTHDGHEQRCARIEGRRGEVGGKKTHTHTPASPLSNRNTSVAHPPASTPSQRRASPCLPGFSWHAFVTPRLRRRPAPRAPLPARCPPAAKGVQSLPSRSLPSIMLPEGCSSGADRPLEVTAALSGVDEGGRASSHEGPAIGLRHAGCGDAAAGWARGAALRILVPPCPPVTKKKTTRVKFSHNIQCPCSILRCAVHKKLVQHLYTDAKGPDLRITAPVVLG